MRVSKNTDDNTIFQTDKAYKSNLTRYHYKSDSPQPAEKPFAWLWQRLQSAPV